MEWQKIRKWIIENYEEMPETKETDLIWLKKKVKQGEKINWSFVDTVDYDIDSIPKKRELILELKVKPEEVGKKWKNLLN